MSINEEPQIEQNISSGSVPTTIRPFDGTDPAYTVEEYLNSIVAAMIFSSGIEPVNKPGHHQWKVKRAALILHTLQGPAQKWYSTLPSETKLDWETFCKEFSDMHWHLVHFCASCPVSGTIHQLQRKTAS